MWGGRAGQLAPRFHVPARSVWFDQVEKCLAELWLTGDADDPVQHSAAFSLLPSPLQEAATPTAGTAPGCQGCFLIQHSSYPGTATHTSGAIAPRCKLRQQKASTCWSRLLPWFFGPEQEPRALSAVSLQPCTSTSCSHVWSRWAGPVCTLISQTAAPIFRSYYSVLKVQRGISDLAVIPNIHSKVNNISCWVFSCNSFDMGIVNLRKRMASEVRGKGRIFSSVATSHHFLQAFDFVFPWKS